MEEQVFADELSKVTQGGLYLDKIEYHIDLDDVDLEEGATKDVTQPTAENKYTRYILGFKITGCVFICFMLFLLIFYLVMLWVYKQYYNI